MGLVVDGVVVIPSCAAKTKNEIRPFESFRLEVAAIDRKNFAS